MKRLPIVAALLCFASAHSGHAVAEDKAVGVVAAYSPRDHQFTLTRPGRKERLRLKIGTVVEAGDIVHGTEGGQVVIHVPLGPPLRYEGRGDYPVVRISAKGRITALWRSLSDTMDAEYRREDTASMRGSDDCSTVSAEATPIVIPILGSAPRIAAGVRDIPLAWTGGCRPFTVEVRSGATILARRENVAGRQLRFDGLTLLTGVYAVELGDARGARLSTPLTVVTSRPISPASLKQDGTDLGLIAEALWLADQDAGAWRLDSFELLRPLIRSRDPLAGLAGDVLLWNPGVSLVSATVRAEQ